MRSKYKYTSMEKKDLIRNHLIEEYHPEAIILHGSRAKGKSRSNSDWDLYVLVRDETEGGTEELEGESLDIDIVRLPIEVVDYRARFRETLQITDIWLDTNGIAKALVSQMALIYAEGRKLTDEEYQNRINFISRVVKRLESYSSEPSIFFYHLGLFYEKAIRYWFELQGKWSMPIYEALPYIAAHDPEYFHWLEALAGPQIPKEKIELVYEIQNRLSALNQKL
jgi:predicted nucleotidyltransferase